jgi:hypothetical protein
MLFTDSSLFLKPSGQIACFAEFRDIGFNAGKTLVIWTEYCMRWTIDGLSSFTKNGKSKALCFSLVQKVEATQAELHRLLREQAKLKEEVGPFSEMDACLV